jgi:UDP-GlcNAc:undecaprenyl-phosphate GlcNAc-1-phosphate transferase
VDFPLSARVSGGLLLAAAIAYLTTPMAITAARRFAFYDVPVGYKGHTRPTPYLGGAAVMLAFALAVVIGAGAPGRTLPLLGGVIVLLVVGTIDDRRTVSPLARVAVEFCVGASLSAAGLGWMLGAGAAVDAVATGIWVVALVNAFNLFDNMDGAASTMALVVAAGTCVLAVVTGDVWAAAGSAALCGACLGFLPHNLASPARIFLGDGGSMPLGLAVAAFVAHAAHSAEPSSLALLVGFLLVGIPVLDTCLVVVSRRRRRVSIVSGGQDHLTHRTRLRMRTAGRVALVLGCTQALVSALVIIATRASSSALVYIVLAFVICAAAAIVALEDAIPVPDGVGPAASGERVMTDGGQPSRLALVGLAVLGLGAGISPLFSAYYDLGVWVSIGLVLVVAAAAFTIARPPRLSRSMMLSLVGVGGLGLWSLLSATWGHDVEQATVDANLWLTYLALLLLLFVLLRGRLESATLLGSVAVGIAIVAASVLVRMLGDDPGSLFLGGRLNAPLGYINGEGCVFAMGCWLGVALAERREGLVAGLGAAAAVVLACLTLMSQSRGAAIATFVAIVVVVVVAPGVRRRLLVLALVAGAVLAAEPAVARVYSDAQAGALPASVVHRAAAAILLAALAAGLVWGLLVVAERAIARRAGPAAALRRAATVAAVAVVLVPVAAAVIRHSSIEHTLRSQWHAFVHLSEPGRGSASSASTQTRLFSGAGNRYDYWRIAWRVFTSHPIVGVGAGNYTEPYFQQRRTTEAIQNPHSVELQTLAELGLIGAGLFVVFVAGAVLGGRRLRAAAKESPAARTAMIASTGMAVVWLIDTSGDWMHLLPGVTAIGLAAVAVLCHGGDFAEARTERRAEGSRAAGGSRVPMLVGAATVAFVLAVAGASLLRAGLTRRYLDDARSELAAHPAAAVTDAGRALRLDSANLDAYYVKAAGLARFDRAAAARAVLLDAARQDPGNFVTWILLGDLEVRVGNLPSAKGYYGRAHALDPHDPSLSVLARNPSTARGGGSPN